MSGDLNMESGSPEEDRQTLASPDEHSSTAVDAGETTQASETAMTDSGGEASSATKSSLASPSSSLSGKGGLLTPPKRRVLRDSIRGLAASDSKSSSFVSRVTKRTSGASARARYRASSADSDSDDDFEILWRGLSSRGWRGSSRLTYSHQLSVGSSSSSSPYLSYHDILLTNEDVKALKSDWLTDNNIAFWEEWLEREILPQYPQARICLLRPTMTFMIMRAVDLSAIIDALPNFKSVTHIFLPINDNHDTTQGEGGTHWSLLLVSVIDGIAFHYDSLHGSNWAEAQSCTRKLQQILNHQLKMNFNIRLLQLNDCPQQENMNDCGVFVCIIMRHLLIKRLLNANANEKVSMSMKDKRIDSYGGRKEMMRIIESLRKEGERRRSASPFATSRTPPRIE